MFQRSRTGNNCRITTPVTEQISLIPRYAMESNEFLTNNNSNNPFELTVRKRSKTAFEQQKLLLNNSDIDEDITTKSIFYNSNFKNNQNEISIASNNNDNQETEQLITTTTTLTNNNNGRRDKDDESAHSDETNCQTLLMNLEEKCGLDKLKQLCAILKSMDSKAREGCRTPRRRHLKQYESHHQYHKEEEKRDDKSPRKSHSPSYAHSVSPHPHDEKRSNGSSERRRPNRYDHTKYRPCIKPNQSYWHSYGQQILQQFRIQPRVSI